MAGGGGAGGQRLPSLGAWGLPWGLGLVAPLEFIGFGVGESVSASLGRRRRSARGNPPDARGPHGRITARVR
jgi:hypothetical protein